MEMLPRFKIQYPMKNRGKDENESLLMKEENYAKLKSPSSVKFPVGVIKMKNIVDTAL
jgi:hypothetical protein